MIRTYSRYLTVAVAGSALLPMVTVVASRMHSGQPFPVALAALSVAVSAFLVLRMRRLLEWLAPWLDADAREQVGFLQAMPARYVNPAIAAAAGLSLFLELAVIRWQGTEFPFFAFYTNFGLLACFAGLGLGYALAARDRLPLALVIPLLGWQIILLIGLRAGLDYWNLAFLGAMPVVEQYSMGLPNASTVWQGFAIYYFLSVVFLLTALAFLPVGQLCGRLMTRRPPLLAYGLNLLGSLGGVVVMFLASAAWTPPIIWYAAAFAAVLLLSVRRQSTLVSGAIGSLVVLATLAWPTSPYSRRIYSPYQMLELGTGSGGLLELRAAGHYYQRVHDFSPGRVITNPVSNLARSYYNLPYRIRPAPADVAIVGAGTGNDVAAALRGGAGRIDAIEIDPAILQAGRISHPEHPYANPRVHAVVNDARSFLRNGDRTYDLIVYGLLDSHTLVSASSSVRLDSFVYTVNAFREARARLKPGGRLVLSFAVLTTGLGRKMEAMLTEAFDGVRPTVIAAGYDAAVVFIQAKDGGAVIPDSALAGTSFQVTTKYSEAGVQADPSTDDWPFFYMPRRIYPVSYLVMLGLVLLVGVVLTTSFVTERPRSNDLGFLLLGAGFMLVETKAITELGLVFGSTWVIIGVVIAGILLMAFLANLVVIRFGIREPRAAFALLVASLALGWLVTRSGGLPSTPMGRLGTVALLTSPMFFSGIVFSTMLGARRGVAAAMAANLVGAMCGGLLEYNSMYFGFRFLYLLAMGFYGLAFVHWEGSRRRVVVPVSAEAPAQ